MEKRVEEFVDLIIKNHDVLRKRMKWEIESNKQAIMGSLLLANKGVSADAEKYIACKKLLKKKAGIFSEFRGIPNTIVITKMTLASDPEQYLDGCLEVYKKLRTIHKLIASPYMVMAALTIYENGGIENADNNISKL